MRFDALADGRRNGSFVNLLASGAPVRFILRGTIPP